MEQTKGGFEGGKKKHMFSIIVIVLLVTATILFLKSKGEEIHFKPLFKIFTELNHWWIVLAFIAMILYVIIEGRCLAIIAKPLGYRLNYRQTTVYAGADIYFSAITPSATGGQPASAYYMVKDGMKGSEATTTLVLNILMYTASLILMGLWALVWKFDFLINCHKIFKMLYVMGFVTQLLLLALCLLCMFSKQTIKSFGGVLIRGLYKLKFVKNKEKKMKGINDFVDKYEESVQLVERKPLLLVKVLICNMMQRMAYFTIGYCVYRSFGFNELSFLEFTAIQLLLMMAVNSLPIPGAIGVSEGNFLSIFGTIYTSAALMPAMIFTRLINYYICFILCGIITLCYHISIVKRDREGKKL